MSKYLYASTRIRAMENNLIDMPIVNSMIDAKDIDEVLRILNEHGYEGNDLSDYENIMLVEKKKTKEVLASFAPEKYILKAFTLKYDIHNMKVLLKAKYLGEDKTYLLSDMGDIGINALTMAINEKDFADVDKDTRDILEKILEQNTTTVSPQNIDDMLDIYLYNKIYMAVKKSKSKILMEYIQSVIDFINIKTFIRIKATEMNREDFKKAYIANGKYDLSFYMSHFDNSLETFKTAFSFSDYKAVVEIGIDSFLSEKKLTQYETISENYSFEIIKKTKMVAFGVETIIAYFLAKENEIKVARMIITGKLNAISDKVVRERLREVYV